MAIQSVKGSRYLFSITDAVHADFLKEINRINWHGLVNQHSGMLHRWNLTADLKVQQDIESEIAKMIPEINDLCRQKYTHVGGTWQICEPGFTCGMHTDGRKPNVMIIYWQVPGPEYGTTFYNAFDFNDVFHEFLSIPNTGFLACYEAVPEEPWPDLWHAAMKKVPENSYRLITQYEFQK